MQGDIGRVLILLSCSHLVSSHHKLSVGSGVESVMGSGSKFWFTVPLAPEVLVSDDLAEIPKAALNNKGSNEELHQEDKDAAQDDSNLKGLRVLLIEDNAISQRVTEKMLNSLGCSVEIAGDGYEALRLFSKRRLTTTCSSGGLGFDLVLCDIQLPGMDGHQTAFKIRELEQEFNQKVALHWRHPDFVGRDEALGDANLQSIKQVLPIIALSGMTYGSPKDKKKKKMKRCPNKTPNSMDDFLSKPIQKEVLKRCLLKWSSKGQRHPRPCTTAAPVI